MKPKRITKKEYWEIKEALSRKARSLSKNGPYLLYFSPAAYPCSYILKEKPKEYRWVTPSTVNLYHFMPFSCGCDKRATVESKEEVICLCVNFESATPTYYLTTHRIGRCPWKTKS